MNRFNHVALVATMALAISGCATSSPMTLQKRTAGILGYPVNQVSVSDMRTDSSATYYIATVNGKRYACAAEGGMSKILQLGMTNPPVCHPQ